MKVQEKKSQKHHIRWMLVCYDALIYLMSNASNIVST